VLPKGAAHSGGWCWRGGGIVWEERGPVPFAVEVVFSHSLKKKKQRFMGKKHFAATIGGKNGWLWKKRNGNSDVFCHAFGGGGLGGGSFTIRKKKKWHVGGG